MKRMLPLLAIAILAIGCDREDKLAEQPAQKVVPPGSKKKREGAPPIRDESGKLEANKAALAFSETLLKRNESLKAWATAVQAGHTGDEPEGAAMDQQLVEMRAGLGDHLGKGADETLLKMMASHDDLLRLKEQVMRMEKTSINGRKLNEALSDLRELVGDPKAASASSGSDLPQVAPSQDAPKANPLSGIPTAVAAVIKQKADLEYPSNPRMHAYEVEKQAEGWAKIRGFETQAYGAMPYAVKKEIVDRAKREWTRDYSMQAYEFEKQAKAWSALEDWEHQGIPGVAFAKRKELISAGRSRWGTNYSMVVYEVEKLAAK